MTSWLKLTRPSWWTYHWKYRNVARFWWQYVKTRPWPDGYSSIDDLVAFSKRNKMLGFNHEHIRAYIFWRTHQLLQCSSFVETGTLYGQTAGFVRRAFKTPLFTCEISNTYSLISAVNLLWASRVRKFHLNSPDFLKKVCRESSIGSHPMFFLDAHWYEYFPLADELAIIGEHCESAVIVIDDFFVPWEPGFRFDEYPSMRIDLDVVNRALHSRAAETTTYLPTYKPSDEPYGKATGFAIVLLGKQPELPVEDFPFNLLAKAPK